MVTYSSTRFTRRTGYPPRTSGTLQNKYNCQEAKHTHRQNSKNQTKNKNKPVGQGLHSLLSDHRCQVDPIKHKNVFYRFCIYLLICKHHILMMHIDMQCIMKHRQECKKKKNHITGISYHQSRSACKTHCSGWTRQS